MTSSDKPPVIVEKYSRWVRWTHWSNTFLLALMIWSGILIYWANDIYRPFFPDWFYNFFGLHGKLAEGMAVHFAVMWLFVINGIVYTAYLLFSGEWREIAPTRKSPKEALEVTLHDLGLRPHAPPQGKLNAAQRIAYTAIIFMGMGSLATGLAIYKPTQLHALTSLLGGYEAARLWHFILTLGYVGFLVIHLVQVIRAGWGNFRAMVAGFEIKR